MVEASIHRKKRISQLLRISVSWLVNVDHKINIAKFI